MSEQRSYKSIAMPAYDGSMMRRIFLAIMLLASFVTFNDAAADGLFDFQMKLAQKGNAEAQFKIGEMYEAGRGVTRNMDEAAKWINKAAKQGHDTARFKLLYWDLQKGKASEENKTMQKALRSKADGGDGYAQYYVGKMYANGVGYGKNLAKAQDWLNKAVIQGVLEAENELVTVREQAQREALAKRRAEEKRKAKLKAQQEADRQKQLAAAKKAKEAEAKRKAQAEAKRRADAAAKADAQSRQNAEAERQLAEKAALEKEREARRQELLSQRKAEEAARKAKFESDPCSGKSARFLSTCR